MHGRDALGAGFMQLASIPGIVDVTVIRGCDAHEGRTPDLLVEVPHGATTRADLDDHCARLRGPLPSHLHTFFHVNTDEGAWEYGLRTAERVVATLPERAAMVLRCRIPRTLIDTNRIASERGAPSRGGVTPGLQPYIHDPEDQARLRSLHERYLAVCDTAFEAVCSQGGLALFAHTYAPHSIRIGAIGADIAEKLRWAYEPEQLATWDVRPEVDLINRTADGTSHTDPTLEPDVATRLEAAGYAVAEGQTYALHPSTMGYHRAMAWPGQTLGIEVRRDVLCPDWPPFTEAHVDPARVDSVAEPLADALVAWFSR